MADVAPEMLEQIQSIFENKVNRNRKIAQIYRKIEEGAPRGYDS